MKSNRIILDHGGGGRLSHQLISELMLPAFHNPILSRLDDSAVFEIERGRIAFSTDSYIVDPIFFPGGNIGDLAINGTVNDISMSGAKPLYLSVGMIIEEGFSVTELKIIIGAMQKAAEKAGVKIVAGDTKVTPKGVCDKIFINTSGVGVVPENIRISSKNAQPGDRILLSGTIADHGIAVLVQRENLSFDTSIQTDSAPLNRMVGGMISASNRIHVLRDPTRGGLGCALNEIALNSDVGIEIDEGDIPVADEVAGICELLGFDPLYIANEGKLVAFVPHEDAEAVLESMRRDEFGRRAGIIGRVVSDHPGRVVMKTRIGGERIVDMPAGEQLPRIC